MKLILAVTLVFLSLALDGQNKQIKIDNNSIKYRISRISMQLINDSQAVAAKYIIRVQMSTKDKNEIKKWGKNKWEELLQDKKTDWAANLILYDKYERDAILFNSVIKSRKDWLLTERQKDLNYWFHFLK
jgi:hypothetical protein